jgi:hypothetical protein
VDILECGFVNKPTKIIMGITAKGIKGKNIATGTGEIERNPLTQFEYAKIILLGCKKASDQKSQVTPIKEIFPFNNQFVIGKINKDNIQEQNNAKKTASNI